MSEVSSCYRDVKSSVTRGSLAHLKGNVHWGNEGTISELITTQQYYNSTGRKKSNVRLNDQLIPNSNDINLAEKTIKIGTLKEHPYSSHISRFAMFPSFRSPDDPETGVRATSQSFLNLLIPNRAPDVTVLSKTIDRFSNLCMFAGSGYRHEILKTPVKSRKSAAIWPGEKGFLDQRTKPLKGENQVFYPAPPKTILPNPKLRSWDLSLSERTSNMLRNLEKTLWLTSYQMHYTGSGPANPLKIDDFREKISDLTGIHSHSAPLRERSYPVFVTSKPKQGYGRKLENEVEKSTYSPTISAASNQITASAIISRHGPQEITALRNEAPFPNQMGHTESKNRSCSAEVQHTEPSQEVFHKRQTLNKSSVYEEKKRENCKVRFDESLMQDSESLSSQEANSTQMSNTEHRLGPYNHPRSRTWVNRERTLTELCLKDAPSSKRENLKVEYVPSCCQAAVAKGQTSSKSHAELLSVVSSEQEAMTGVRELLRGISNPCIVPRLPALPGIHSVDGAGAVRRGGTAPSFLELLNSFSKSEAHKNFNSLITQAAVNLRDNAVRGKKHNFHGINCNYIHG
ncbi:sperm-associated microtubule inner protein 4 [Xenentodon cancila]